MCIGVLHSYMYGSLYNPKSKIIVRTTVSSHMAKLHHIWLLGLTACIDTGSHAQVSRKLDGWLFRTGMVSALKLSPSLSLAYTVLRTNNATIEVIIEASGFNNSLAGSLNCPNANSKHSANEAKQKWIETYLKDGMPLLPSQPSILV